MNSQILIAAALALAVRINVSPMLMDMVVSYTEEGGAFYEKLLTAGVRIFEYQPTMMHAKTMVVDGIWSTIGSSNFDERSFRLNDEVNVGIYDARVASEMEAMFEEDLARSKQITYEAWRKRPAHEKLWEGFAASHPGRVYLGLRSGPFRAALRPLTKRDRAASTSLRAMSPTA